MTQAASITVQADAAPLIATIDELEELTSLEGFREFFERTFGLDNFAAKLVCLESKATEGALLISLEPSDRLLDFLAAARAGDFERNLVE
jgi:hypothetical protein